MKEDQSQSYQVSDENTSSSESPFGSYNPDTLENMRKRAKRLKEIVKELDESQIVTQSTLMREFDI